jgi:hypothetical protein
VDVVTLNLITALPTEFVLAVPSFTREPIDTRKSDTETPDFLGETNTFAAYIPPEFAVEEPETDIGGAAEAGL